MTKQARMSYADLIKLRDGYNTAVAKLAEVEKDKEYWRQLARRCLLFAHTKGMTTDELIDLMTSARGPEVSDD